MLDSRCNPVHLPSHCTFHHQGMNLPIPDPLKRSLLQIGRIQKVQATVLAALVKDFQRL